MTDPQLTIPVPAAQKRSPLTEPCRRCGASPGEPCLNLKTGKPIKTDHKARKKLAEFKPVAGTSGRDRN